MRAPSASFFGSVPGWQSRKYSPISDCGRLSQIASVRSEPKPSLVTSMSTSASCVSRVEAQLADRPRAHARDLEVGAGDQAERVVELDGERVPAAAAAGRADGERAGDGAEGARG